MTDRPIDELRKQQQDAKKALLQGPYGNLDYRQHRDHARNQAAERKAKGPPPLPLRPRFEGMWVVGRQGTGKTQLFKLLISRDLDLVAQGKASIVILDPTGDEDPVFDDDGSFIESGTLINTITRLKRFAPGGDLYGKLVYVDPSDSEYTLPLNLCSLRPNLNDDDAVSSAISTYVSIMGGLMRQPLTPFQEPVLRYAVQAVMAFDRPTLQTLMDVLTVLPKESAQRPIYEQVADRLPTRIINYLRTTYETQTPRGSRGEILNRLASLVSDPKFARMFMADTTKIDVDGEMNQAKVIVINASRTALSDMKEMYARYFLGQIKAAGEARPQNSIPCFIYIDECDEFVKSDKNAADIILKLRRKRMALILGNQLVSRIDDATVREAFLGTAIKFANTNLASAIELAESMNLVAENGKPDTSRLVGRPRFDFAYHISGEMDEPQRFRFKPGALDREPRMTADEFARVRQEIRERYYIPRHAETAPLPKADTSAPFASEWKLPKPRPKTSPEPDPPAEDIGSEGATSWGRKT